MKLKYIDYNFYLYYNCITQNVIVGGKIMAHISLRVTDKEKKIMENYANFHGITLSDAIKDVFFKKLEDEYDLQTIAEFEIAEKNDEVEYKTFEEVIDDLGLEDEI